MGRRRERPSIPPPLRQETTGASVGFSDSSPIEIPTTGEEVGVNSNKNPPSRGKRKWTSPCWKEYDCYDGSSFPDKKARAFCKYCKKGPILADAKNGTTNFIRHTENCYARSASDVSQMLINKGAKLSKKKFEYPGYKEVVCLAIIRHGYPFTFAEHDGNRAIHTYLNDECKFFSRLTAQRNCFKIHKREKTKLKKTLSNVTSKICLTSDLWNSLVDQEYLSLTAHYIDDKWNLHNKIVSFCHLPPPHNAAMVHDKILSLIKDWDLQKKVFSITLDNAKYNDNMSGLLANSLSVYNPLPAYGDYFHVRCSAHILNLIVQDGLKTIIDATYKIRHLVRYISGSELRKAKFRECAISAGVDYSRGLYSDCPTRWNACYKMLERAVIYKLVYPKMKRIDKDTPSLLTDDEWTKIEKIIALLKPFDEITTKFSGRNYPTANLYFRNVWRIQCLLVKYSESDDQTINEMAAKMIKKFDKYWENYSMVLSFAAILDPRYKFHLVRYCFEQLDPTNGAMKANHVKDELHKLFAEYADTSSTSQQCAVGVQNALDDDLAGFSLCSGGTSRNLSQLDLYLEESKLDHNTDLDVLQWWKTNESRLPHVARMARDLLSIPITSVASESCFSLAGRVLTKFRSSLNPNTAETLVTTRSWIFGYEVEKDPNSLEDGWEIPLDPNVHESLDLDTEDDGDGND